MTAVFRVLFSVLACAMLVACGADGEPVQPQFVGGVSVGSSGVHTYGGVGASKGPFSVFLGF